MAPQRTPQDEWSWTLVPVPGGRRRSAGRRHPEHPDAKPRTNSPHAPPPPAGEHVCIQKSRVSHQAGQEIGGFVKTREISSDLWICRRQHLYRAPFPSAHSGVGGDCNHTPTDPSHTMLVGYGLASSTRLNGVSVARRKRPNPASDMTSPSRASPAWAPSPSPTSCASELGVHRKVEPA